MLRLQITMITSTLLALVLCGMTRGVSAQDTDLDVVAYHLSLRLDLERTGVFAPLNTMSATARITFRNTLASQTERVPVVLNRLLAIEAVRTDDGKDLNFQQRLLGLQDWETYQANTAVITLDEPLQSGDTLTLEIDYRGGLRGVEESGMLYVQETLDRAFTIIRAESSAYPHLAEPTRESLSRFFGGGDGFNQVLEVTVPESLVVASGHELVGKHSVDGWVTWTYRSRAPVFQIIIPVAPYEVIEVGPARIYHFPEDREGAARVARGISDVMDLFTRWFGTLHDKSTFAVAEIPEWHGSQALRPTTLQEATAFRDASGMAELYHEISHFWNVEDPAPNASRWNEGLATYLQNLVAETLDSDTGRLNRRMERYRARLRTYLEEHPEHRDIPLIQAGERDVTSVFSYVGGGIFFGLLHHRLGQARLLSVLGEFYQQYYESGATSREFSDFLTTSAPEANRIVNDWFLGSDHADLLLRGLDFDELVDHYAAGGSF